MLDPTALQHPLSQHGIPALVKAGTYDMSSLRPPTGQRRGADHHDAPRERPLHGPSAQWPGADPRGNRAVLRLLQPRPRGLHQPHLHQLVRLHQ
jgi:hypothetical protein